MVSAISFALALFLSSALIPVVVRYAGVLKLVDLPDGNRKIHCEPIPRVGGIAITLAFFVPAVFWLNDVDSLISFLLGGAIIAVFGFMDDRHDLNYKWKFFGQIIAVVVFLTGNIEITKTPFLGLGDVAPWISYPILMLFILGVTNAVNLSDGLDGLAAGSSLLSLGFLAFLAYAAAEYSFTIIAVSAMGALTGFLRFNTHPATVFMGDTGSQFLGYVAACLAVMVTQSGQLAVSPMLAVVIVGLPILDTLMVMLLRLRDGNSPFKPDKRHLHHQFLAIGFKHYQAVAAIYVLNFILLGIAYLVRYQSDVFVLGSYFLFCGLTLGLIAFFKYSKYSQQRRARLAEKTERRNDVFRKMHWLHLHGANVVQYLLGGIWLGLTLIGTHTSGRLDLLVLGTLVALLVYWRVYNFENRFIARVIFYIVCVLSVFLLSYSMDIDLPSWRALTLLDLPILLLVVVLALAIRTTRKNQFRMDTQDVLVLLVLLAAPLLTLGVNDEKVMVGAIVRLIVLLYASEYIITRIKRPVGAAALAMMTMVIYLIASYI